MKALVIGGSGATGPHVLTGLLQRGYDVAMLHRGVHEPAGLPAVRHIHADPHFAESLESALDGEVFDLVVAMYGRLKAVAEVVAGRWGRFLARAQAGRGWPSGRRWATACTPTPWPARARFVLDRGTGGRVNMTLNRTLIGLLSAGRR